MFICRRYSLTKKFTKCCIIKCLTTTKMLKKTKHYKKNNNLSLLNKKELSLCAKTICNNHEKTFYNFQLLTFLFWRHVTGEKQHASVS